MIVLQAIQTIPLLIALLGLQPTLTLAESSSLQENSGIREARKYDEFGNLDTDSESAILDAFSAELNKEPHSLGYVISYNERRIPPGRFLRRIYGYRHWLVGIRGLEANRIVVINGGYREGYSVELWVVPPGVPPPRPISTIPEAPVIGGSHFLFDAECLDCAPAADIYQSILREGVQYYAQALHENRQNRAQITVCRYPSVGYRQLIEMQNRVKRLLITQHGVDQSRINTRTVRSCSSARIEYWIIPGRRH